MERLTLILITVLALYVLFKVLTSAIDTMFKIAIGILVLSFLGYSFFGWEDISNYKAPSQMAERNISTNENTSITTPREANITTEPANSTLNITNANPAALLNKS